MDDFPSSGIIHTYDGRLHCKGGGARGLPSSTWPPVGVCPRRSVYSVFLLDGEVLAGEFQTSGEMGLARVRGLGYSGTLPSTGEAGLRRCGPVVDHGAGGGSTGKPSEVDDGGELSDGWAGCAYWASWAGGPGGH